MLLGYINTGGNIAFAFRSTRILAFADLDTQGLGSPGCLRIHASSI